MRAKVLLIDDEPGIREMLSLELSQEGFEVEAVGDGFAAIRALQRGRFDLAITDLKMPGMDGVAVVEALRSLDPALEVIVATGYASVDTAVACMKHGAYDYIRKPYDLVELVLLLERALEKKELQSLVALYEASRSLVALLAPAEVAQLAVTLGQKIFHSRYTSLALKEENGFVYHRPPQSTLPSDALLGALAAQALDAHSVLFSPSPLLPQVPPQVSEESFASVVIFPLYTKESALGALIIASQEPNLCSPSLLQRGTVFANQLVLSLENARLYGELSQRFCELQETREQLLQAEKLALVGSLVGLVAHEVNNPLLLIRANLMLLREHEAIVREFWEAAKEALAVLKVKPSPSLTKLSDSLEKLTFPVQEAPELVEEALEGTERLSELSRSFSKLAEPPVATIPEVVEVNALLWECCRLLPGEVISPRLEVTAELFTVVAREDLKGALLNLLLFLCSPERKRRSDINRSVIIRAHQENGRVCVVLSERSLLFSIEERRRIFDPRMDIDTRKGRTLRLNLALSFAYQMLRRNKAEISVGPEESPGLTFRILLPAVLS